VDTSISFDDEYFDHLVAARSHPWVAGMLALSRQLVGPLEPGWKVLDAGCGTGAQLEWLRSGHDVEVTAFDVADAAVRFCRATQPDLALARASIEQIPFRDATFELVCSADVLQHLPVAVAATAVREVARVLKPGGRFFVRTNAACGRSDVREQDDWRLYRPERLAAELEAAGLVVERVTFANTLPAAAATMRNQLDRLRRSNRHGDHLPAEHEPHHGIGIPEPVRGPRAFALSAGLAAERRYLARPGRTLRWGHTLVALARRP
jgi:SAM-dependent methyltransferase